MNCPRCDNIRLVRGDYEGERIRRCPNCYGMLVSKLDRQSILRKRVLPTELLVAESELASEQSQPRPVECPNCFRTMEVYHRTKPVPFTYDLCSQCEQAWFDPGELALLQFAFEMSDRAVEADELKERWANLPPAARADYERRVNALPDFDAPRAHLQNRYESSYWWDVAEDIIDGLFG